MSSVLINQSMRADCEESVDIPVAVEEAPIMDIDIEFPLIVQFVDP